MWKPWPEMAIAAKPAIAAMTAGDPTIRRDGASLSHQAPITTPARNSSSSGREKVKAIGFSGEAHAPSATQPTSNSDRAAIRQRDGSSSVANSR